MTKRLTDLDYGDYYQEIDGDVHKISYKNPIYIKEESDEKEDKTTNR